MMSVEIMNYDVDISGTAKKEEYFIPKLEIIWTGPIKLECATITTFHILLQRHWEGSLKLQKAAIFSSQNKKSKYFIFTSNTY